ncbi:MAG TPA: hypothetical protein VFC99_02730, partial [Acidimicrobiia bacterium]|nr:hypothetical protein [Acidimicrobiia bacterium]
MSPAMGASRYGADRAEIARLLEAWGEPRYRAEQVWDALYRQRRPLEDATALPRSLREAIGTAFPLALDLVVRQDSRDATTTKWLWSAGADRAQVET